MSHDPFGKREAECRNCGWNGIEGDCNESLHDDPLPLCPECGSVGVMIYGPLRFGQQHDGNPK